MAYKGMMLSGVPNFAFTIGYTNASWTLKADLVGRVRRAACSRTWTRTATGSACRSTTTRASSACRCWTSPPATSSARSHLFPKGGSRAPWRLGMSYAHDVVTLRHGGLEDGALRFSAP